MKKAIYIIIFLLFILTGYSAGASYDILLSYNIGSKSQTILYTGGSVSIQFITPPSGPIQQHLQMINSEFASQGLSGILTATSISTSGFVVAVSQNNISEQRVFNIIGDNNTASITQNAAPPPDPDPDPDPEDPKFNIAGNWIYTRTYIYTPTTTYIEDITFYNGLGYAEQFVQVAASSETNPKNIITPIVYDNMLRDDAKVYLPYASTSQSTKVKDANALASQKTYYTGVFNSIEANRAFSENIYEASPLNRVISTKHPGNAYLSYGETNIAYSSNTSTEVKRFRINSSLSLVPDGNYGAGTLYKSTTTDENDQVSVLFTDKQERVIMERKVSGTTNHDTYYIYDDYGNLGWVITPVGSETLPTTTQSITTTFAKNNCYIYKYDGRGNVIEKRAPGREWEYYVYDKGNRMVLYQDGVLRGNSQWIYHVYDNFNQMIEQTLVQSTLTRTNIQSRYIAAAFNNSYPTLGGTSDPLKPLPGSYFTLVAQLISTRYYEHKYGTSQTPFTIPAQLSFAAISGVVIAEDRSTLVHGLLMYEKIFDTQTPTTYIERAYYYDLLGRPIQIVEKNHLGGISRTSYKYKFSGDIEIQHESHQSSPTATADTKKSTFTYDTRGRVLSETTIVNNSSSAQVTVNYSYNKLGQLTGKSLGSQVTETYAYNIQGWLTTKIAKSGNNNLFSSTLRYYDKTKDSTIARYNGNISEWEWQQGVSSANKQTYGYTYDGLNRLTNSLRYVGTSSSVNNAYTEREITYDRNGNIKSLKRYGSTSSTYVNNLNTASYTGNKLTSIKDGTTTYTYAYDNNGNMTTDGRRGINIGYNFLNLPKEVKDGSLTLGTYTYLADGTKTAVAGNTEELDYLGSLIYKKTGNTKTLENIIFSEGVINKSGATYNRMYHIRDHLGSVRVVTDNSGANIEQNDYYPFGMRVDTGSQTSNRYKFSGKEIQTMVASAFNYLDFGARHYDPVIVRWSTQDPMAEKYYGIGQYVYVANNPVINIDPDGREVIALNSAAQQAILNTLPKEIRGQVQFDNTGRIDRSSFNQINTSSGNFGALSQLVNDNTIFEVNVADKITYKNEKGQLIEQSMGAITLSDDKKGSFGFNTGEEGWQGVTQTPGNAPEKYNSPNDNVMIVVNSGLSVEGQAQNFAHEAYGHGYLYSKGQEHRHQVKSTPDGFKETNTNLRDAITRAIKETIDNMLNR